METPPPVDLNKLRSILGDAKKIMARAEELKPTVKPSKNIRESQSEENRPSANYDENDEREPEYKTPNLDKHRSNNPNTYTAEQVMASNLPPAVKEAMIRNPIPQVSMSGPGFTIDDVSDLVEKPKQKTIRSSISESIETDDIISVSKSKLNEMVNKMVDDRLLNFLKESYTKTISEAAIKKTINTLIKEGKISVKK